MKFNDPFDHHAGFALSVDPDNFARLLTESTERIIFTDVSVPASHPSLFKALVFPLRSALSMLPRDEVCKELHEASLQVAANLKEHITRLNSTIHHHLCHSRVFCVSERHDNVVMWSHYAEGHCGVVFKLRCIDEIDNSLLAARKVVYSDSFVALPSAENFAKHLTGEEPIDLLRLCWDIAHTKHIDWSYEREWRIHVALLNEPAGDGFSMYHEDPRVFEAVYLGCRMEAKDAEEIVKSVRQYLPKTKVYQAARSQTEFALAFSEVREI